MMRPIRLGISTCPNDTFAFHAILNNRIDLQGLEFSIQLLDIEQLNRGLFDGAFDVAKASFATSISLADRWFVLPSGSAIGFGVGPLLLAAQPDNVPESMDQTTLCPGEHTTATLLFNLFYGNTKLEHDVFSKIMPALQSCQADFGVCIHEGRFTYQDSGLFLVEDLGERWESETNCPLPLGGMLASRDLPEDTISNIQNVIQNSINYGLSHRDETLATMRKYAQEFSDTVLMKHVELYVNKWTVELGDVGQRALHMLSDYSRRGGISGSTAVTVFGQ